MATYQVKVRYGNDRFSTFLIQEITFAKLMREIKTNCSQLAHLPSENIRLRYLDDDGDYVNLQNDSGGFSFTEMLRTSKEVQDRDFRKITLHASEID